MSPKYANYAQLVQGVSQVYDPRLSQGERLFLLALAAFTVKTDPHPGNQKLAQACGVLTPRGVQYIAKGLVKKQLVQIVEVGNGRGKATVYRLCTEDPRYPWPDKPAPEKPQKPELPPPEVGSLDFAVSNKKVEVQTSHLSNKDEKEVRSPGTRNREVNDKEVRSSDVATDLSTDTTSDKAGEEGRPSAAAAREAFEVLDDNKPFGSFAFQHCWIETYQKNKAILLSDSYVYELPRILEECIQLCQQRHIKPPPPFFREKRLAEQSLVTAMHTARLQSHAQRNGR
jgi:hypothetical protein